MSLRSFCAVLLVSGFVASPVFAAGVPKALKALFDKVDGCAHNDSGSISTYSTRGFSAAKAIESLRQTDRERGCGGEGRAYSTSRASGVKMFRDFLKEDETASKCLAEKLTKAERTRLDSLVADPTNLAVLASVFEYGDNPEGCSYYNFDVYTAKGVVLSITFNYTD